MRYRGLIIFAWMALSASSIFAQSNFRVMRSSKQQVLFFDLVQKKISNLGGVIDSDPKAIEFQNDVYIFAIANKNLWYRSLVKPWKNLGGTCIDVKTLRALANDVEVEAFCDQKTIVYRRTLNEGWTLVKNPNLEWTAAFTPAIFENRFVAMKSSKNGGLVFDLETQTSTDIGGSIAGDPIIYRSYVSGEVTYKALGSDGFYYERTASTSWKRWAPAVFKVMRGPDRQVLMFDLNQQKVTDLGGQIDSDPLGVELNGDVYVFALSGGQLWYRSVLKKNWKNLAGGCAELKSLRAVENDIVVEAYCSKRPTVYSRSLTQPWALVAKPTSDESPRFSADVFESRYVAMLGPKNQILLWDLKANKVQDLGGSLAGEPKLSRDASTGKPMVSAMGSDGNAWEKSFDSSISWRKPAPVVAADSNPTECVGRKMQDKGNFEITAIQQYVFQTSGGGSKVRARTIDNVIVDGGYIFVVTDCGRYTECRNTIQFKNKSNQALQIIDYLPNLWGSDQFGGGDRVGEKKEAGESFPLMISLASEGYLHKEEQINVGVRELAFSDGSRYQVWLLSAGRDSTSTDDLAYMVSQSKEVLKKLNQSPMGIPEILKFVTAKVEPSLGDQQFKYLYTLGALLQRFPKKHPLFDQNTFDNLENLCTQNKNFFRVNICLVERKFEFERLMLTGLGYELLKKLPPTELVAYDVTKYSSAMTPASSVSVPMDLQVANNDSVESSVLWGYNNGKPTDPNSSWKIWNWGSVLVPAVKDEYELIDIQKAGERTLAGVNAKPLEGSGHGEIYQLDFTNRYSSAVRLVDIAFDSPNLKLENFMNLPRYSKLYDPINPGKSVSIYLRSTDIVWSLKSGELSSIRLTKYKGKVIFKFETVDDKKSFTKTFKLSVDQSESGDYSRYLKTGFTDFEKQKADTFESPDGKVVFRRLINTFEDRAAFGAPVPCEPGRAVDFRNFLTSRDQAKPASGDSTKKSEILSFPSIYGRVSFVNRVSESGEAQASNSANRSLRFIRGFDLNDKDLADQMAADRTSALYEAYQEPVAELADGDMISFGTTTTAKAKMRFLTIRNPTDSIIKVMAPPQFSSSAFQLFQSTSLAMAPYGSSQLLLKFAPWAPASYYTSMNIQLNDGIKEGHTFWLTGEASDVVEAGATVPTLVAPLIYIDGRSVSDKALNETDFGGVTYQGAPNWLSVVMKNPTTVDIEVTSMSVGAGFILDRTEWTKRSSRILKPRELLNLKLAVDSSRVGVKSAVLKFGYKVAGLPVSWVTPLGGIVWSASLLATEGNDSPTPSPSPGAAMGILGGEVLDLASARTKDAFVKGFSNFQLMDGEPVLQTAISGKTEFKSLWDFIRSSKRVMLSQGAKELMNEAKANLEGQKPADVIARISSLMSSMTGDELGKGRSDLIRALSAIDAFKTGLRVYTQMALSSQAIERMPRLNSLGRYYLRIAFLRAYLATSPPVDEAWETIQPYLARIKDPLSRNPLLTVFLAQFPEVAASLADVQGASSP